MRISRAVKEKSKLGRCGTTPIKCLTRAGSFHTSCSPIQAWPEVGRTRVVRTPTVVDLPAPFGPRRPKISPGTTSSESPSRAGIWAFGCLPPLASARAIKPPAAPNGGDELYTLRRSQVRTPTAIQKSPQPINSLKFSGVYLRKWLGSNPGRAGAPAKGKFPLIGSSRQFFARSSRW